MITSSYPERDFIMDVSLWVSAASGLRPIQGNPDYTREEFNIVFPQFTGALVPDAVFEFYKKLANSTLSISRWGDLWENGMGLFIAHFLTLWMKVSSNPDPTALQVISDSQKIGLVSSKQAGSLSLAYDNGVSGSDLEGWGSWKLSLYGQQFATFAKLVGKGGMYVW